MGYSGRIHAVHPHREEVAGVSAVPSVAALPEPPDAAFIGVNRHATVQVTDALRRAGAGGAVAYAAGFREAGREGAALEAGLREAAGGMPLLGPNCYGFINYLDGSLLWPDQHGGTRRDSGVAIITQSSNVAINLTMGRRGLPLAYMVTLGNQAATTLSDLVPVLAADPRVTAVGILVEGLGDIAAFTRAANAARESGTPVVALRAGRSDGGAQLAFSHTASLGGSDRLASARLAALGVREADDLETFVETLKLLHCGGPLKEATVVSLSCSGGEAILMADAGATRSITFPPFSAERHAAVAGTVGDLVTVSNPFDYHTFMWGDAPAMTRTFRAVMEGAQALTALILDLPRADRCDDGLWRPSLEALVEARRRTGGRAALVATLPDGLPEETAEGCLAEDVAPLVGLGAAMAAVRLAAHDAPAAPSPAPLTRRRSRTLAAFALTEPDAKALLARHGIAVPSGERVAAQPAAVWNAARAIGAPVAVKAVVPTLAHKTEAGGVILDVRDEAGARRAAERLATLSPQVLVEAMVEDAVAEVLLGYRYDRVLGGTLILGSGGILAELVGDAALLPLPTTRQEADAALADLRVDGLIRGHRGRPPGDREALLDAVLALATFCEEHVETLEEADINPMMVRPQGRGVVAADALMRMIPAGDIDDG